MPCCRDAALLGSSGFSTATPVGAFCTPIASKPREAGRSMGLQKWRPSSTCDWQTPVRGLERAGHGQNVRK
jgi:hypothetical protein